MKGAVLLCDPVSVTNSPILATKRCVPTRPKWKPSPRSGAAGSRRSLLNTSKSCLEGKPLSETSATTEGVGVHTKVLINPMHPSIRRLLLLLQAPRCGAKTRAGAPCQSPAVSGKARCRMHGGAKGSGAPKGSGNGNYRHGQFTCEAIEERRVFRRMMSEVRAFADSLV